eukprot:TRINITY_DN58631_c0_g1_i1.p1 TRINITY_DN58631_c0_g1~~TRINITY_DN58631_c0_g1_i1.p1  ORF type:complete len:677 (-),score=96.18 TRINITY_DN58631_c0_g1_i1:65-1990(-)
MTMDEKIGMVHGVGGDYVGDVPAVPRLKIPALHLEDGPQGVGDGMRNVTAWPSALTVVAAWDTNLMFKYGQGMGQEQRIKGSNVMLGPMVNIARVPVDGRSFESYGEDPWLAAGLVSHSISGIQSAGVIGCVKHFVDNNQEYNRTSVSENVDERTQHEIYLPAFRAAIKAGVMSVMCSYNRVNNMHACQNHQTLTVDLKEGMGFEGWVMSDWGATHSTVESALAGLDQEMPRDEYFGPSLKKAIQDGKVPESRLDDMVTRILTGMYAVGIMDHKQTGNKTANAQSAAHTKLAQQLAQAGTVLVKNEDNALPLNMGKIRKIAVIGDDASKHPTATGGGSGHVIAPYIISPLQGLQKRLGPSFPLPYAPTNPTSTAVKIAKEADVALVFVAVDSSEGHDRKNLSISYDQDELVHAVAAAQPNTIVVVHSPGAILMPWVNKVKAVVCAFLPGQMDGDSITEILMGDVNPSGRLPLTFPLHEDQNPVNTIKQYPGINNEADYSEKLLVGYRWWDAKNIKPLFWFGHGLSYTTFAYSGLVVNGSLEQGVYVQCQVKNTGSRYGAEIVQLYVRYPGSAGEPFRQLRGFEKLALKVGQARMAQWTLQKEDLSVWDTSSHSWKAVSGELGIYVGGNGLGDLKLHGTINV